MLPPLQCWKAKHFVTRRLIVILSKRVLYNSVVSINKDLRKVVVFYQSVSEVSKVCKRSESWGKMPHLRKCNYIHDIYEYYVILKWKYWKGYRKMMGAQEHINNLTIEIQILLHWKYKYLNFAKVGKLWKDASPQIQDRKLAGNAAIWDIHGIQKKQKNTIIKMR